MLNNICFKAPDFIWENLLELAGTLAASIIVAIISTYIFNRIQVINKVKSRVIGFRLDAYNEISSKLNNFTKTVLSNELNADIINDISAQYSINISKNKQYLCYESMFSYNKAYEMFQYICSCIPKKVYVLDNDTVSCLIKMKIYLQNYTDFPRLLKNYCLSNEKPLSQTQLDNILDTLYPYLAVFCYNDFEYLINEFNETVHLKRTNLKFEKPAKNYRLTSERTKLKKALSKHSTFDDNFINYLGLTAQTYAQQVCSEQQETAKEAEGFIKFIIKTIETQLNML